MQPNEVAVARFAAGNALLVGIVPVHEALPALADGPALSHAGPPLPYARMCGPMQGALRGAAVFESWAPSPEAAHAELLAGRVRLHSNHEIGAVAPMAGVISPSMYAFVVENPAFGNRVATTINEGVAREVLRCGANSPGVLGRLRWLNDEVMGALQTALGEPISLRDIMAEAVLMGDELHQRNAAATLLFLRSRLKRLAATEASTAAFAYFAETTQFFLNLAMASSKVLLDPLSGIEGCTLVTAMSRNGVEFGIRVSGTGERWFRAPSPSPAGVYWETYTAGDANPDIGDSAIVETAGAGGFILPGAPAVYRAVGCHGRDHALLLQAEMRAITAASSPFLLTSPAEGVAAPFGIDVERVVATGTTPVITTGIAHRNASVGMIGAGIVRAPFNCFTEALTALAGRATPQGERL